MPKTQDLACFALSSSLSDLPAAEREHLKVLLLDTIGCALGTLSLDPVPRTRRLVDAWGGAEIATLVGGGRTSPENAAFYNTALTRYMDFMDGFSAKHESCHPSDNFAMTLAAAEGADRDGRELLSAIAVAYETQTRLLWDTPITRAGFDHTTQLAISGAVGVGRAVGLDEDRLAHAIAIAGTCHNSLRVERATAPSNWKGLASSDVARGVTSCVALAKEGVTGPLSYFEGNEGYEEVLASGSADFAGWKLGKDDKIPRIFTKKHNAEIHAQSAIEAILALREEHDIDPGDVKAIEVETFKEAYTIIGGGDWDVWTIRTKDQADHSFPYLLAVALLDGQVQPAQFAADRILRDDVQELLRRVRVKASWRRTHKYPDVYANKVVVELRDGRSFEREAETWDGHWSRPWTFDQARVKFDRLAAAHADESLRDGIARVVRRLEDHTVKDLCDLLAEASTTAIPRTALA